MNLCGGSQPVSPCSRDEMERVLDLARRQSCSLIEAWRQISTDGAALALQRLGASLGLPAFDLSALEEMHADFDQIPFAESVTHNCLLLRDDSGQAWLVVTDPFDMDLNAWAQERVRGLFRLGISYRDDLAACCTAHEQTLRAIDSVSAVSVADGASKDVSQAGPQLSLVSISEDDSPVVRLVNSTLYDALRAGVSDVHLETSASGLIIKHRLDGVLGRVGAVADLATAVQAISRVKVMAELDISERRVPQDGRFRIASQGRDIDVRVSIMPSIHGEDAVLRILDKRSLADRVTGLRLENLGFDAVAAAAIRSLAAQPYGMLLVTGPTGSGKTTTLYAAITEINNGSEKIVTIEDPVEYQLPGVLQIPVNEKKGLSFARGLRSILRHDPDRIMVGEIRDAETAQIAIQAALTGHLVFTTVHANNAFDVLGRFAHMQIDPYNLVSAVNGIVAQRLIRLLCTSCAQPVPPEAGLPEGRASAYGATSAWRRAGGCANCRGTGYRGRRAIAEILVMSDELRDLIVERAPASRLRKVAAAAGCLFLREQALRLVAAGETSIEEANRVTLVA